jgi:hypothetical protein
MEAVGKSRGAGRMELRARIIPALNMAWLQDAQVDPPASAMASSLVSGGSPLGKRSI